MKWTISKINKLTFDFIKT